MSDPVDASKNAEASRKIEVPFYLEPKDSDPAEAAPKGRDNYVLTPVPGEIVDSALPWIVGSFSILPYLETLKAKAKVAASELKVKAGEAAVELEGRALDYLNRKLAEIPAKPNFDEDGTLRQFNPIVKMQIEQAWKTLTARQQVEFALAANPDAKLSVKHPPEEPPQFWVAAAARALLSEAEMPQMGGGLEEAAARVRLAADFGKLEIGRAHV